MRSGRKNAVVSIYSATETVDPTYNSSVRGRTLWKANVFCDVVMRRGREVEIGGQIQYETYVRFEFEYFDVDGISETMTIVHEGVSYDIRSVLKDLAMKLHTTVDAVHMPEPTGRTT